MTYRMPKSLEGRISDETFAKLMDIASSECDTFLSFGGPQDHFERAVIAAARLMLDVAASPPVAGTGK